jgi:ABC-type Fe3+-hydroxamate transport system substrate-binding protein
MTKRILLATAIMLTLAACSQEADVASQNLSQAADNFEINRRVTFINGITNTAILTIEGLCSLGHGNETKSVTVTCKVGPNQYKKHFLGLSDNVTYMAEQLDPAPASVYRYRVTFNPTTLIPDINLPL